VKLLKAGHLFLEHYVVLFYIDDVVVNTLVLSALFTL